MSGVTPVAAGVASGLQSLAQTTAGAASSAAPGAGAQASFFDTLKSAVGQVDSQVANAAGAAQSFAGGNQELSVSDVMISLEQANLAFQTAATVRDKVTEAYNTVMNMQV